MTSPAGSAVAAAFTTAALVAVKAVTASADNGGYIAAYSHPHGGLERLLARGDGQAFAAFAHDPLLRHPQAIDEVAYRASRPLLAWLTWLGSAGHRNLIPYTQALVVVVATGFAAMLAHRLIASRGGDPKWAVLVAVLPGTIIANVGLTSETLAATLILAAFAAGERHQRVALLCWCLAALTRETAILAALGTAVCLWRSDRPRAAMTAALPVAAWVGWLAVVNARLRLPLLGVHQAPHNLAVLGLIHAPAGSVAVGLAALIVAGAVLYRRPDDVVCWAAAGYSLLIFGMGPGVVAHPDGVLRVLAPLAVMPFVALAARTQRAAALARDRGTGRAAANFGLRQEAGGEQHQSQPEPSVGVAQVVDDAEPAEREHAETDDGGDEQELSEAGCAGLLGWRRRRRGDDNDRCRDGRDRLANDEADDEHHDGCDRGGLVGR